MTCTSSEHRTLSIFGYKIPCMDSLPGNLYQNTYIKSYVFQLHKIMLTLSHIAQNNVLTSSHLKNYIYITYTKLCRFFCGGRIKIKANFIRTKMISGKKSFTKTV